MFWNFTKGFGSSVVGKLVAVIVASNATATISDLHKRPRLVNRRFAKEMHSSVCVALLLGTLCPDAFTEPCGAAGSSATGAGGLAGGLGGGLGCGLAGGLG